MKDIELNQVKPTRIVAIADKVHYIWTKGITEVAEMVKARQAYEDANKGIQVTTLMNVIADYDTDEAYIFYVADCFSPPMYLVFGHSFQDAYDNFCTECEHLIKIDADDLKDYGDNFSINDNSTPIDAESVQYLRVDRLILDCPNVTRE